MLLLLSLVMVWGTVLLRLRDVWPMVLDSFVEERLRSQQEMKYRIAIAHASQKFARL